MDGLGKSYKRSITFDASLEEHSQQDTHDNMRQLEYKGFVMCRPILTINTPLMD